MLRDFLREWVPHRAELMGRRCNERPSKSLNLRILRVVLWSLNQRVAGSNPASPTNFFSHTRELIRRGDARTAHPITARRSQRTHQQSLCHAKFDAAIELQQLFALKPAAHDASKRLA